MKANQMKVSLLAIAVCLLLIMGCSSKSSSSSSASPSAAGTPSASVSASVSDGQAKQIASPSWKTDTSACKVTWFVAYDWYGKKFSPETNEFDKWVLNETGCSIEFQTGDTDKLNVLISTDSLPDVVTFDANTSQRTLLENSGKLLPMNKLINDYAPDFVVPKSMIDWYTAPDGNWYAFTNFYYGDDNVAANKGFYETHNQNFARKDILDQIGMKADDMRTKEGFIKALRTVKEQGVTYAGQKMLPYAVLMNDKADEQMALQFGASMETKDGKYQSIYRAPEYLEALEFYNQLYNEGLLTDESFTMKKDQMEQKVASGELFATTRWTNVSISRGTLYGTDPNAQFLYAGLMRGDNHDRVAVLGQNNAGWAATMITKNAKQPDRIIQLLSFMSQNEFTLNHEWGIGAYQLADGHVVQDEAMAKIKQEQPAEWAAKYVSDLSWMMDYSVIQGTFPEPKTVFDLDTVARTRDAQVEIYDDKPFAATAPIGGSEEAAIQSRVQEYVKQALGRIVTAGSTEECEKQYNAMMTELDNLGLQKLETYQDTKFQENKQKLGLTFAHPFNR
ncbi:hypothetical protein J4772_01355 [Cohnella sp. LGH]|uniref:hypothetical protein n=1 Tax=Cohnella sp. LGH TaxID=1619153 RepID=UPI001ADD247C|nr:hypothetical protein [Cohnella sp. LGH]QTH43151.1 hypothetical protein J4772_01355 [Cohnella sp. LGH]